VCDVVLLSHLNRLGHLGQVKMMLLADVMTGFRLVPIFPRALHLSFFTLYACSFIHLVELEFVFLTAVVCNFDSLLV
jgi:hypothetical protein